MRTTLALPALTAVLALSVPAPAPAATRRAAPAATRRAAPAPEPISLSRLLARTFRLYGGVDALLGVGGIRVRAVVDDGSASPGSRPELERLLRPPDRYRSTVSLGGLERESLVLDGTRAFRDGAEVTGLVRADQIRLEAARAFLPAALARERAALVDRGEATRGSRRVRLVELRLHDDAILTAELDAASGRILRATIRAGGRESVVEYGRLRPISGVLFPFAEEHRSADGRHRVVIRTVEIVRGDEVRVQQP